MTSPDYSAAIAHAINRLRSELPPHLTYHNWQHTAEDVLPAVQRLAVLCDVPESEYWLLTVAAAYHDIGYIFSHENHEQIGTTIAAEALPSFGFSPEQIEIITSTILATRLPQNPKDYLGSIMADADLDVLGREDFFERSQELRHELSLRGKAESDESWLVTQIKFLRDHSYITPAALALRQEGKERNISYLEAQLGLVTTG